MKYYLSIDSGGTKVAAALFDEQEKIPAEDSFMTSSYFDEIYHARTAYEHIQNIYPYEVSTGRWLGTQDLLERMLHEDVFMGADEAIRYGIAHEYETELI